jgi:hypothetical protein
MSEAAAPAAEAPAPVPAAAETQLPPSLLAAAPAAEAGPTRPPDLPDQFWDPKTGVLMEPLVKSWSDLRKTVARGEHKPPASPDAYELAMPEGVELQVAKDDPAWGAFRKAAHAEGLSADLVKRLVAPVMAEIAKAGQGAKQPSPEDQAKQQTEFLQAERAKLGANAEALTSMLGQWVSGAQARGLFTAEEVGEISVLAQTAAGVRALAKLREMAGEKSIPIDPGATPAGAELADYYRLVESPEWQKGDRATRDKAAEMLASLDKRGKLPANPPARFGLR